MVDSLDGLILKKKPLDVPSLSGLLESPLKVDETS